jgi:glycosyltransferase involved in cell wall biosynthesis
VLGGAPNDAEETGHERSRLFVKILYHHRTLADGAEGIHIHEMVSAFRSLGHQVELISLTQQGNREKAPDGLLANLRHRLPRAAAELALLVANLPDYFLARRAFATHLPDVVYKRHALFDVAVSMASKRRGIPMVLEVNALYSHDAMRRFEPLSFRSLARALERTVIRSATVVVAVSTPMADRIREVAGADVTVLVCPNGANPNTFDPGIADGRAIRARLGLSDSFVVGWTGVLRAWHGLDMLIQSLETLPDLRLLVVGDGPERKVVEHYARTLGVHDRVIITGRIPHREVPDYVAAFDVAVASDDQTGMASPMKVVEYMALARPVVVPRLPNFEDLVRDGVTGLQFRAGDHAELSACLRLLRDSRRLRNRLGAAARDEVCDRLNWVANARAVCFALEGRSG